MKMVAKVILIFSIICTSQVFSLKLNVQDAYYDNSDAGDELKPKCLVLKNLSNLELGDNVIQTLKETEGKRNKFGELVTFSVLEPALKENNNKAGKCFNQLTESFTQFMLDFYEEMKIVLSEIEKDLSQKPNEINRIITILDNIICLMNSNLHFLYTFIQKGNNINAADYISYHRTKIQEHDYQFLMAVIKYGQKSPKKARLIGKKYCKIRKTAQQKSKTINCELEKCLKS